MNTFEYMPAKTVKEACDLLSKYGEEAMKMAKERLCSHCLQERSCLLLPLCLDGSDCPYFRKSEVNSDA